MDFTIIVPAFNVEKYIQPCLNSLQQQNYPKDLFEVLIINDGSTDKTQEVIESVIMAAENFKLINQSNGGVSMARNRGIELAKGDYVLFVDGDDRIRENVLHSIHEFIRCNDLDLAHFNIIDESSACTLDEPLKIVANGPCMSGAAYYLYYRRLGNARDTACTTFFKRELLEKYDIRFSAEARYLEDGEFLAKAFAVAERSQGTLFPLYIRTARRNSVTQTKIQNKSEVIQGICTSALSLKAFGDAHCTHQPAATVINQAKIKFVTLVLLLTAKKLDVINYLRYYKVFKDNGLNKLNPEGVTLNFPELARKYNRGWLSLFVYAISQIGPIVKLRRKLQFKRMQ